MPSTPPPGQTTGAVYLSRAAATPRRGRLDQAADPPRRAGQPRPRAGLIHCPRTPGRVGRTAPRRDRRPAGDAAAALRRPARTGTRSTSTCRRSRVLAVQVNVPARPVLRMTVGGCRAGGPHNYQTLFIGMGNTGNQFVKGTGSLAVTNAAGRVLKRQSFAVDTFLPADGDQLSRRARGQAARSRALSGRRCRWPTATVTASRAACSARSRAIRSSRCSGRPTRRR